jgi:hypothetical protein
MKSSRKRNQISSSAEVGVERIDVLCPVSMIAFPITSILGEILNDRRYPYLWKRQHWYEDTCITSDRQDQYMTVSLDF